jgi:hypothetical protein
MMGKIVMVGVADGGRYTLINERRGFGEEKGMTRR